MKKIFYFLFFLTIFICLSIGALPWVLSQEWAYPYIQSLAKTQGKEISFKKLHFSWLGNMEIEDLEYKDSDLKLSLEKALWKYSALDIINSYDIGTLILQSPHIKMKQLSSPPSLISSKKTPAASASTLSPTCSFDGVIKIQHGELELIDEKENKISLHQINGKFHSLKGKYIKFNLDSTILDGKTEGLIKSSGHIDSSFEKSNLNFQLDSFPIVLIEKFLPTSLQSYPKAALGELANLKGNLRTQSGIPSLQLNLKTDFLNLEFDLKQLEGREWSLLSPSVISWHLSKDLLGNPTPMNLSLRLERFSFNPEVNQYPVVEGAYSVTPSLQIPPVTITSLFGDFTLNSLGKLSVQSKSDIKVWNENFKEVKSDLLCLLFGTTKRVSFHITSDKLDADGDVTFDESGNWKLQRPINLKSTLPLELIHSLVPDLKIKQAVEIEAHVIAADSDEKIQYEVIAKEVSTDHSTFSSLALRGEFQNLKTPLKITFEGESLLLSPIQKKGSFHGDIVVLAEELDQMAQLNLTATHFPTEPIEALTGIPFKELLGSFADFNLKSDIKEGKGPLSLDVQSANEFIKGEFEKTDRYLTLKTPLEALLQAPSSLIDLNRPISFHVTAKNSLLPIDSSNYSLMQLERILCEIGQVKVKRTGLIGLIADFLKLDTTNKQEVDLWFTPLYARIRDGLFELERGDALIGNSLPFAFWGTINLADEKINLLLGLPKETLEKAFKIYNAKEDHLMLFPIRGTLSNPKFDLGKAIARITALRVHKKQDDFLGEFLQVLTAPKEEFKPAPSPTTTPFPWEGEKR